MTFFDIKGLLSLFFCLFRSQIFGQICHGVTLDLHGSGTPGEARSGGGVDTGGVIHEIGGKGAVLDLAVLQVPGQLMNNGPDHLQVPQFLGAYKRVKMEPEDKNA